MGELDEEIESVKKDVDTDSQNKQASENLKNKTDVPETSEGETKIFQNPKENTRRIIASLYVCAFFVILFVCLLIGVLNGYTVDDYKDMLIAVSGVLSGPLGFIVGYYFKASTE